MENLIHKEWENIEFITDHSEELKMQIGSGKEEHFIEIFKNENLTFNWSAFLGGYLWLAYRRMYLASFIYWLFFTTLIHFVFYNLKLSDIYLYHGLIEKSNLAKILMALCIFLIIVLATIIGLIGNTLYFNSLKVKIKKGRKDYGPNKIAVLAVIVIIILQSIRL